MIKVSLMRKNCKRSLPKVSQEGDDRKQMRKGRWLLKGEAGWVPGAKGGNW